MRDSRRVRTALVVLAAALVACGLFAPGIAGAGEAELPPPQTDPEEVRQAADDILARPEFQAAEPSIWDEIRGWIGDRLSDLFADGARGAQGSPVFGYFVLTVAIIGVAYLLYRWLRGLSRDADADDEEPVLGDDHFVADDWRAAAERCESAGQWKEAIRCRYRVLVSELVERQVVGDAPGRTAGEYRAEVADGIPAAAPPFDAATELFELAWYADEPTGPDENQSIRSFTDRVVETVR